MKSILPALLAFGSTPGVVDVPSEPDASALARCKSLESANFSGVRDAPNQVVESKLMEAKGDVPAYWLVKGYVWPNVRIEFGLPARWFMEVGCGGHCGVLPGDEQFPSWCGPELRKGYLYIVSDMGHIGGVADALWAYNNLPAKVEWAIEPRMSCPSHNVDAR